MKNNLRIFISIVTALFVLVLAGCISSQVKPAKQVSDAQDAVAKQEKKID